MIQKPWKRLLLVLGILFMKCRLQVFVPGANLNERKLVQTPLSAEGKAHNRRDSRQSSSLVLDVVHVVPRYPVDDILLTDLNHSDLVLPFGNWAMCEATNEAPKLRAEILSGLRLLVLLRTTVEKPASGYGTTKKVFNVPFLVDTGSPQTFLCEDDYKILGIEAARNVYIEDVPCRPQISTEHFMDINLLGTDVLKKTSLFVDYTNLTLHLGFFDQGGMGLKLSARLVYGVSFKIVYLHLILSYACICSHANWRCCSLPSFCQITGSFLALLPARWYWNPDQSHLGAPTSRGLQMSAYRPQFKCRVFYSLYRFQKLLKKMPFNNILPQVQSIKLMYFFPLHDFQNRTQSRSLLFMECSS